MKHPPAVARWSPWTLALVATLGIGPGAAPAAAGDPAGTEFRVNLATAGDQRRPVVAMDASGGFAVAFRTDGGPGAVRRFAADGNALGIDTPLDIAPSAIAMDDAGDFVVAGTSANGAQLEIQCFDAQGNARGAPRTVHSELPAPEFGPVPITVAMDADGDFVVAWQTLKVVIIDNGGYAYDHFGIQEDIRSIYARRYDAQCAPRAEALKVTTAVETRTFTGGLSIGGRSGRQVHAPAVAAAPDGRFVVAWASCAVTNRSDACSVYARRYRATGAAAGLIFRLSPYGLPAPGAQDDVPLLAMAPDGGFVAVLHDHRGRRFSPLGIAQGAAFPLLSPGALDGGASAHVTSVAMDDAGRFVVAAQIEGGPYDEGDVLVRRFAADSTPEAPEVVANTFRALRQGRPATAMAPDGRFVVVWDSGDISGTVPEGQDGSGIGVYGQRFEGP